MDEEKYKKLKQYVLETFKEGDHISRPILTRKLKINYNPAKRMFDELESEGYIKRGVKKLSVSTFIEQ